MKPRYSILIVCLAVVTFAASSIAQEEQLPYVQHQDLVYGESDGVGLLMDVFTPSGKGNGLGIVDVASGAWYSDRGKINDHKQAKMYDIFCARGYTVFAVRPGSRTKWTFEEMLAHVETGIRYVKAHAQDYGIDPDRLGLVGASAGGHLATLTAVSGKDGSPEGQDETGRYSTHVKAVAVFFPPTDFADWDGGPGNFSRLGSLLFEGGIDGKTEEEVLAKVKQISPRHNVHAGAPPFLFIHGDADPLVPLQQSETMVAALHEAGVDAELIVKEGGAHPWPTIPEEVAKMADWLDKRLAD